MKKKIMYLFGIMLFAVFLKCPMIASAGVSHLVDGADLLTDSEELALSEKLDEFSARQKLDIVIITVSNTGDRTATEYADDAYDNSGYSEDGILLLISMDDREWAVSTSGYGITAFSDAGLDYLMNQISDAMSAGEWNEAFYSFAELCDDFITQARTGAPYDSGNLPKKPFTPILTGIVSLGIGFVIAFFRMNKWRSQLYTVQAKKEAEDYVKGGSMNITERKDLFLYKRIDRRKKADNDSGRSSKHTSSSGKTHGGASGKF